MRTLPPPARASLPREVRFEGHAIVSADGMIAAADGSMPDKLRNAADWQQFQAALDDSCVVVLGRLGHQAHRNPGRRRLVFTSQVERLADDPSDRNALLFNPGGATLADVLAALGIEDGTVAVTGGGRVFDYFLPVYDRFSLAESHQLKMPAGRPCFSAGHPRTVLSAAGLVPRHFTMLDPAAAVTITRWDY